MSEKNGDKQKEMLTGIVKNLNETRLPIPTDRKHKDKGIATRFPVKERESTNPYSLSNNKDNTQETIQIRNINNEDGVSKGNPKKKAK